MSSRMITPWSEGPDYDFLAALTADFNSDLTPRSRDSAIKKAKVKRKQGYGRTKSTSEEVQGGGNEEVEKATRRAERQISISSDISIDEDVDMVCL